jgi:hypothetical protein
MHALGDARADDGACRLLSCIPRPRTERHGAGENSPLTGCLLYGVHTRMQVSTALVNVVLTKKGYTHCIFGATLSQLASSAPPIPFPHAARNQNTEPEQKTHTAPPPFVIVDATRGGETGELQRHYTTQPTTTLQRLYRYSLCASSTGYDMIR